MYLTAAGVVRIKAKSVPLNITRLINNLLQNFVRARRVVQSLSFPDRARQAHTVRM